MDSGESTTPMRPVGIDAETQQDEHNATAAQGQSGYATNVGIPSTLDTYEPSTAIPRESNDNATARYPLYPPRSQPLPPRQPPPKIPVFRSAPAPLPYPARDMFSAHVPPTQSAINVPRPASYTGHHSYPYANDGHFTSSSLLAQQPPVIPGTWQRQPYPSHGYVANDPFSSSSGRRDEGVTNSTTFDDIVIPGPIPDPLPPTTYPVVPPYGYSSAPVPTPPRPHPHSVPVSQPYPYQSAPAQPSHTHVALPPSRPAPPRPPAETPVSPVLPSDTGTVVIDPSPRPPSQMDEPLIPPYVLKPPPASKTYIYTPTPVLPTMGGYLPISNSGGFGTLPQSSQVPPVIPGPRPPNGSPLSLITEHTEPQTSPVPLGSPPLAAGDDWPTMGHVPYDPHSAPQVPNGVGYPSPPSPFYTPYTGYNGGPDQQPVEDLGKYDNCMVITLYVLGWILFWPILLPWLYFRKRQTKPAYVPADGAPYSELNQDSKIESTVDLLVKYAVKEIPKELYNNLLLRLPSLYFSRVARIFEEADLSLGELKKMALETASKSKGFHVETFFLQSHNNNLPPVYQNLKHTWENFIDAVMREWKTFNVISVLLLSAILTILQIEDAATDAMTRYTALASLVCALMSLLYGCMYIIRFGTMRKPYKAAEWALEAKKSRTVIFWNVWVMLAMPAVWLSWSLILYIWCIMSFLWRTSTHEIEHSPISSGGLLAVRIVVTTLFGLGSVYGVLVIVTFRRYGEPMDNAWKERINGWIAGQFSQPMSHGPIVNPYLQGSYPVQQPMYQPYSQSVYATPPPTSSQPYPGYLPKEHDYDYATESEELPYPPPPHIHPHPSWHGPGSPPAPLVPFPSEASYQHSWVINEGTWKEGKKKARRQSSDSYGSIGELPYNPVPTPPHIHPHPSWYAPPSFPTPPAPFPGEASSQRSWDIAHDGYDSNGNMNADDSVQVPATPPRWSERGTPKSTPSFDPSDRSSLRQERPMEAQAQGESSGLSPSKNSLGDLDPPALATPSAVLSGANISGIDVVSPSPLPSVSAESTSSRQPSPVPPPLPPKNWVSRSPWETGGSPDSLLMPPEPVFGLDQHSSSSMFAKSGSPLDSIVYSGSGSAQQDVAPMVPKERGTGVPRQGQHQASSSNAGYVGGSFSSLEDRDGYRDDKRLWRPASGDSFDTRLDALLKHRK